MLFSYLADDYYLGIMYPLLARHFDRVRHVSCFIMIKIQMIVAATLMRSQIKLFIYFLPYTLANQEEVEEVKKEKKKCNKEVK